MESPAARTPAGTGKQATPYRPAGGSLQCVSPGLGRWVIHSDSVELTVIVVLKMNRLLFYLFLSFYPSKLPDVTPLPSSELQGTQEKQEVILRQAELGERNGAKL